MKSFLPTRIDYLDTIEKLAMQYFYNKHRVLMDLCDEIALYNGYEPKDLPSPWTILRQMYDLKQEIKKSTEAKREIDFSKLPLFRHNEK